jgi:pimeloyl-ACP methyl ester carboxylesterase
MNTKTSIVAIACTLLAMPWGTGCAADETTEDELAGDAEELGAGLAKPTAGNSLLIAFDGTGNVRADNRLITKDQSSSIYNLYASAVVNGTKESSPNQIRNDAAVKDSDYTYNFWKRFDAAGVTKAIYFSGPPRPGLNDTPWRDSGAKAILDAAFTHSVSSPVCDAIQQTSIKNVYLIGYSRGAVLAHEVAFRIGNLKRCGAEAAKKLKWVGLIDPVDTGMSAYKAAVVKCPSSMAGYSKGNGSKIPYLPPFSEIPSIITVRVPGYCLAKLPVPVLIMMKDGGANLAAANGWLASIPVSGGRVSEVNYSREWSPTSPGLVQKITDPHIDMAAKDNEVVIRALKSSASSSGLRF